MRRRPVMVVVGTALLAFAGLASTLATAVGPTVARTDHQASGNRVVEGRGPLERTPLDVELGAQPTWVLPDPTARGTRWLVVLEDGSIVGIGHDAAGTPTIDPERGASLPPGEPPLAMVDGDGQLHIVSALDAAGVFEDPIPGARVVQAADGTALALTSPTERYPHGALADRIEAGAIDQLGPDGWWARTLVGEDEVVEGLSAIVADIDDDGAEEVIVTVSDAQSGARLQAHGLDDGGLWVGESVGQGYRWLHQVGVGPVGPDGETEIIVVRTPHIGGVVEAWRVDGARLVRVASEPGYRSHRLGSDNLDMALLADTDGDGRPEVVVPTQAMDALGVLARTDEGFERIHLLELDGTIATNVAATVGADGRLRLAVGTSDGRLRVFG